MLHVCIVQANKRTEAGESSTFNLTFYGHIKTAEQRTVTQQYCDSVIGTLAVDGCAVTFGTARRGLSEMPCLVPFSLYQMSQPTHQRPVYQLHIIKCGTAIYMDSKGLTNYDFQSL